MEVKNLSNNKKKKKKAPAAPAAAEVETTLGAEFDPAKVRYGRRNVVKKIPVEDSPESTEEAQA